MARNRFSSIAANLWFNDRSTRAQRRSADKFALKRDFWQRWMNDEKRTTRRWPFAMFCNILDISAINTQAISKQIILGPTQDRRMFIRNLCENIINMFKVSIPNPVPMKREFFALKKNLSAIRCFFCPRKDDRKTRKICCKCKKPICDIHSVQLCLDCGE